MSDDAKYYEVIILETGIRTTVRLTREEYVYHYITHPGKYAFIV